MRARLIKCIGISAVILAGGCAYAAFCLLTGFGLPCPFRLVTGLSCPGCGVTRMLLHLLRLDFAAAFRSNAVLLCLLPVLAALGLWRVVHYIRCGSHRGSPLVRGTELAL